MAGSILVNTLFPIVMSRLATSSGGWVTTVAIFMVPLTLIGILRFIFIKEDGCGAAASEGFCQGNLHHVQEESVCMAVCGYYALL